MGVSVDSKIKVLVKNEAACKTIEEYLGDGFSKDPQMKLVGGLSLRKLCSFPQAALPDDKLAELDEKLKALGD